MLDLSTADKNELVQGHLDRVSRSFAFCIRQLPEPLKLWVGVSYLLCRIVDTIEDSDFKDVSSQSEAFNWFDQNISGRSPSASNYPMDLWPVNVTEGEKLLLLDSSFIFEIFWSMDPKAREIVSKLAHSMSLGMRHFRLRSPGSLRLRDVKEVNQYCFFVAGLVGEMLAHFISQVEPLFCLSVTKLVRAHHFGLFLQKVNLLKDQLKDQKLGRFLVPSREEVEASAIENAHQAFEFIRELPLGQVEFRRFCAWSFFMGLESMRGSEKLSRSQTEDIILRVEENIHNNEGLGELFKSATRALGWGVKPLQDKHPGSGDVPSWIRELYKGQLEAEGLKALGLSY